MKYFAIIISLAGVLSVLGLPSYATPVYLSKAQALRLAFPEPDVEKVPHRVRPTAEALKAYNKQSGIRLMTRSFDFIEGRLDEKTLRYAVMLDVLGKERPISLLVILSPTGQVEQIEIMAYRESRGGEIGREKFRRQFVGKNSDSQLRLNKDIRNITGATISSRAVTGAVKAVLDLFEKEVKPVPPETTSDTLDP